MLWAAALTVVMMGAAVRPPVAASRSVADDTEVDVGGCGVPDVRAVGRYERTKAGTLRFGFSGSGVTARFRGTRVSVVLRETPHGKDFHGRYAVKIDGVDVGTLRAEPGNDRYDIAAGLSPVVHTVELLRRTEGFVSTGEFVKFDFGAEGELLAPGCEQPRRILFVGDSVTAGFGAKGNGPDCDFRPEYEDYFSGFASLSAAQLKAESQAVAWAGHGIMRNDSGNAENTIPELFERAIPTDAASRWEHAAFTPDVVVVLAGANDLAAGTPDPEAFVTTYVKFLQRVRSLHPDAKFVLALSPMLNDVWPRGQKQRSTSRELIQRVARETDSAFVEFDEQLPDDGFGCTWHPSTKTHQKMAARLVSAVRRQLRW